MNLINSKNKRLYLIYFGGCTSLEDDINNWLSKNTDIEIVQIIHTPVGNSSSNKAYIYYYKMNNNLI